MFLRLGLSPLTTKTLSNESSISVCKEVNLPILLSLFASYLHVVRWNLVYHGHPWLRGSPIRKKIHWWEIWMNSCTYILRPHLPDILYLWYTKKEVKKNQTNKKTNQLGTGAHNPAGATSKYSCYDVFTDQFIFIYRFGREVRRSFKPHEQVIKTLRTENGIFDLLLKLRFPLSHLTLQMRSQTKRRVHYRGEKCSKSA